MNGLLHLVRLDFSAIEHETRAAIERDLRLLSAIPEIHQIELIDDMLEPGVLVLIVATENKATLEAYRADARHRSVARRLRDLGLTGAKMDIAVSDLERTLKRLKAGD